MFLNKTGAEGQIIYALRKKTVMTLKFFHLRVRKNNDAPNIMQRTKNYCTTEF